MNEGERERKGKRERGWQDERKGGGCAMGASFQVSNTTSGDGFKPNSLPPINTQAEREYINCLTITRFEKKERKEQKGEKREGIHSALLFYNPSKL